MEDAANKIASLSSDPNFISELERQQIEEYARNYALEKAEERGIESGINKSKVEIAKRMIKKETNINFISECTGLSIEEINELKV